MALVIAARHGASGNRTRSPIGLAGCLSATHQILCAEVLGGRRQIAGALAQIILDRLAAAKIDDLRLGTGGVG
jgi:hypothetical protein